VADKLEEVAQAQRRISAADLRARIADTPWRPRGFTVRLSAPGAEGVNIIAEVKRASPSKGDIAPRLDAAACAREYRAGGAAAVSVLTDKKYFKGSLEDLAAVRKSVALPVLRKEFIVSDYQLYESRFFGADAVLLIVRILSAAQLEEYLAACQVLGLDALVEVHDAEDCAVAKNAGAKLIGINNRNLATFVTRLSTAVNLSRLLAPDQISVAASGIADRRDIDANLGAGIFNFLIGESLVRAPDRVAFLHGLLGRGGV
jgi:indole-3-glycerol phosphate synthase